MTSQKARQTVQPVLSSSEIYLSRPVLFLPFSSSSLSHQNQNKKVVTRMANDDQDLFDTSKWPTRNKDFAYPFHINAPQLEKDLNSTDPLVRDAAKVRIKALKQDPNKKIAAIAKDAEYNALMASPKNKERLIAAQAAQDAKEARIQKMYQSTQADQLDLKAQQESLSGSSYNDPVAKAHGEKLFAVQQREIEERYWEEERRKENEAKWEKGSTASSFKRIQNPNVPTSMKNTPTFADLAIKPYADLEKEKWSKEWSAADRARLERQMQHLQGYTDVIGGKNPVAAALGIASINAAYKRGELPHDLLQRLNQAVTDSNNKQGSKAYTIDAVQKYAQNLIQQGQAAPVDSSRFPSRMERLQAMRSSQGATDTYLSGLAERMGVQPSNLVSALKNPSDQQLQIMQSSDNVVNVTGVAGSGKSYAMTNRAVELNANPANEIEKYLYISPTTSGAKNLTKMMTSLSQQGVLPGVSIEEIQPRTIYSAAASMITNRNFDRDEHDRPQQTGLEMLGMGGYQFMGSTVKKGENAKPSNFYENSKLKPGEEAHDFLRKMLDQYGIKGKNVKQLAMDIHQVKSTQLYSDDYANRMNEGKKKFNAGALNHPDALLYLYEQTRMMAAKSIVNAGTPQERVTASFGLPGQTGPKLDFMDTLKTAYDVGQLPGASRLKKSGAFVDEMQDMPPVGLFALAAMTHDNAKITMAQDPSQKIISNTVDTSKIAEEVFGKQGYNRSFRNVVLAATYRMNQIGAATANAIQAQPEQAGRIQAPMMMSVRPNYRNLTAKDFPEFHYAPTQQEMNEKIAADWFKRMKTTPEKVAANIAKGEAAFKGKSPEQFPIIFMMHEQEAAFKKGLEGYLQEQMGGNQAHGTALMQQIYSNRLEAGKMQGLMMGQIRGGSVSGIPSIVMNRNGMWDVADYQSQLYTMATRTEKNNAFYGSMQIVGETKHDNRPDTYKGTQLPKGALSIIRAIIENGINQQGMKINQFPEVYQSMARDIQLKKEQARQPIDADAIHEMTDFVVGAIHHNYAQSQVDTVAGMHQGADIGMEFNSHNQLLDESGNNVSGMQIFGLTPGGLAGKSDETIDTRRMTLAREYLNDLAINGPQRIAATRGMQAVSKLGQQVLQNPAYKFLQQRFTAHHDVLQAGGTSEPGTIPDAAQLLSGRNYDPHNEAFLTGQTFGRERPPTPEEALEEGFNTPLFEGHDEPNVYQKPVGDVVKDRNSKGVIIEGVESPMSDAWHEQRRNLITLIQDPAIKKHLLSPQGGFTHKQLSRFMTSVEPLLLNANPKSRPQTYRPLDQFLPRVSASLVTHSAQQHIESGIPGMQWTSMRDLGGNRESLTGRLLRNEMISSRLHAEKQGEDTTKDPGSARMAETENMTLFRKLAANAAKAGNKQVEQYYKKKYAAEAHGVPQTFNAQAKGMQILKSFLLSPEVLKHPRIQNLMRHQAMHKDIQGLIQGMPGVTDLEGKASVVAAQAKLLNMGQTRFTPTPTGTILDRPVFSNGPRSEMMAPRQARAMESMRNIFRNPYIAQIQAHVAQLQAQSAETYKQAPALHEQQVMDLLKPGQPNGFEKVLTKKLTDIVASHAAYTPEAMREVMQVAQEMPAQMPVKGSGTVSSMISDLGAIYNPHANEQDKEGYLPPITPTPEYRASLVKEDPMQALMLEKAVPEGQSINASRSTIEKYVNLPATLTAAIGARGPEFGIIPQKSHAAAIGQVYYQKNVSSIQRGMDIDTDTVGTTPGGFLDPMAVQHRDFGDGTTGTFSEGKDVTPASYQKRLEDMLKKDADIKSRRPGHMGLQPAHKDLIETHLKTVKELRHRFNDPDYQGDAAHQLMLMAHLALGKNPIREDVEGSGDPVAKFFAPQRDVFGPHQRGLSDLVRYANALHTAMTHTQQTGTIKREHLDELLTAMGHEPGSPLMEGLPLLAEQGMFEKPEDTISLQQLAYQFADKTGSEPLKEVKYRLSDFTPYPVKQGEPMVFTAETTQGPQQAGRIAQGEEGTLGKFPMLNAGQLKALAGPYTPGDLTHKGIVQEQYSAVSGMRYHKMADVADRGTIAGRGLNLLNPQQAQEVANLNYPLLSKEEKALIQTRIGNKTPRIGDMPLHIPAAVPFLLRTAKGQEVPVLPGQMLPKRLADRYAREAQNGGGELTLTPPLRRDGTSHREIQNFLHRQSKSFLASLKNPMSLKRVSQEHLQRRQMRQLQHHHQQIAKLFTQHSSQILSPRHVAYLQQQTAQNKMMLAATQASGSRQSIAHRTLRYARQARQYRSDDPPTETLAGLAAAAQRRTPSARSSFVAFFSQTKPFLGTPVPQTPRAEIHLGNILHSLVQSHPSQSDQVRHTRTHYSNLMTTDMASEDQTSAKQGSSYQGEPHEVPGAEEGTTTHGFYQSPNALGQAPLPLQDYQAMASPRLIDWQMLHPMDQGRILRPEVKTPTGITGAYPGTKYVDQPVVEPVKIPTAPLPKPFQINPSHILQEQVLRPYPDDFPSELATRIPYGAAMPFPETTDVQEQIASTSHFEDMAAEDEARANQGASLITPSVTIPTPQGASVLTPAQAPPPPPPPPPPPTSAGSGSFDYEDVNASVSDVNRLKGLGKWLQKGNPAQGIPVPSKEQLDFINDTDWHHLVEGGPGGGKTATMTRGVMMGVSKQEFLPSEVDMLSTQHSGASALAQSLGPKEGPHGVRYPGYQAMLPDEQKYKFRAPRTFHSLANQVLSYNAGNDAYGKPVYPNLKHLGLGHLTGRIKSDPSEEELDEMTPEAQKIAKAQSLTAMMRNSLASLGITKTEPQLANEMKNIADWKRERNLPDGGRYEEKLALGKMHLHDPNMPMTHEAMLALHEEGLHSKGDMDFEDQLHYGAMGLEKLPAHMLPPEMFNTKAVAIDELQDLTHGGMKLLQHYLRRIQSVNDIHGNPNTPHVYGAMDRAQVSMGNMGGLSQHGIMGNLRSLLGLSRVHQLTQNFRSDAGSVALNNAILQQPDILHDPRSPLQVPHSGEVGNDINFELSQTQPHLMRTMFGNMLGNAGLSLPDIAKNVEAGRHALAGVDFADQNRKGVLPSQSPAILSTRKKQALFDYEAKGMLMDQGLSLHQARIAHRQLFRRSIPGSISTTQQKIEARTKFPLLRTGGSRSFEFTHPQVDATRVEGWLRSGEDANKGYLHNLFTGVSRVSAGGQLSVYAASHPFTNMQQEHYMSQGPGSLDESGNAPMLSGESLAENPLNRFEDYNGKQVPQTFPGILHQRDTELKQWQQAGLIPQSAHPAPASASASAHVAAHPAPARGIPPPTSRKASQVSGVPVSNTAPIALQAGTVNVAANTVNVVAPTPPANVAGGAIPAGTPPMVPRGTQAAIAAQAAGGPKANAMSANQPHPFFAGVQQPPVSGLPAQSGIIGGGGNGGGGGGGGGGQGRGSSIETWGHNIARIGSELQFLGQTATSITDKAIQQGSDYRLATIPTGAGGPSGTGGFFNFMPKATGNINDYSHTNLPMYSNTKVAQGIQSLTGMTNTQFSRSGTLPALTNMMGLAAMTGMDPTSLMGQMTSITGNLGKGSQGNLKATGQLTGMLQQLYGNNLSEPNVAPTLNAVQSILPTLQGMSPTHQNSLGQIQGFMQLGLNAGMTSNNMGQVTDAMSSLAQAGSSPNTMQQAALARLYPGQTTASPGLAEFNSQQTSGQIAIAQNALQQNIGGGLSLPNLDIQISQAQIKMDTAQLSMSQGQLTMGYAQQAQSQLQQTQSQNQQNQSVLQQQQAQLQQSYSVASFGQTQSIANAQYGKIGQDTSKTAYFSWLKNQNAAAYNGTSPEQANQFTAAPTFGLQNAQFYAGIEHQRSQMTLARSPLMSDMAFQENNKYLNKQEAFYQAQLKLTNQQRQFELDWQPKLLSGNQSIITGNLKIIAGNQALITGNQKLIDIQGQLLGIQSNEVGIQGDQLALQEKQAIYQQKSDAITQQYLAQQGRDLQAVLGANQQSVAGQGPVAGVNVTPQSIIEKLAAAKMDDKTLHQTITQLGIPVNQIDTVQQIVRQLQKAVPSGNQAAMDKVFSDPANKAISGQLKTLIDSGAFTSGTQAASAANTSLNFAGIDDDFKNLIVSVNQLNSSMDNLAAFFSPTAKWVLMIGSIFSTVGTLAMGVASILNILGLGGGASAAGAAGGAGAAAMGAGGVGVAVGVGGTMLGGAAALGVLGTSILSFMQGNADANKQAPKQGVDWMKTLMSGLNPAWATGDGFGQSSALFQGNSKNTQAQTDFNNFWKMFGLGPGADADKKVQAAQDAKQAKHDAQQAKQATGQGVDLTHPNAGQHTGSRSNLLDLTNNPLIHPLAATSNIDVTKLQKQEAATWQQKVGAFWSGVGSDTHKSMVDTQKLAANAWGGFTTFLTKTLPNGFMTWIWTPFTGFLKNTWNGFLAYVWTPFMGFLKNVWTGFVNNVFTPFWNFLTKTIPNWFMAWVFTPFWNFITKTLPGYWDVFKTDWNDFWQKTLPKWWEDRKQDWTTFWNTTIPKLFSDALAGLKDLPKTIADAVTTFLKDQAKNVGSGAGNAFQALLKMFGGGGAQDIAGIGSAGHPGFTTTGVNRDFHAMMSYGVHQGVDFAANEGTPLREFAPAGTVKNTGFYPWGGEVDVDIGGGLIERYLHLSLIAAAAGQKVKQGDFLGLTGGGTVASGLGKWSSGSHSHIQYDFNNINDGVNPWDVWSMLGDYNLAQYYGFNTGKTGGAGGGTGGKFSDFGTGGLKRGKNETPDLRHYLAEGGVAMTHMQAIIGEKGPEAVLPIAKLASLLQTTFNSGATATAVSPHAASGGGKGLTVAKIAEKIELHVHTTAATLDEQAQDSLMAQLLSIFNEALKAYDGKLN